jgi:hypothetical protein
MSQRPGEVITRVCVDSLEKSQRDPNVYRGDVEVLTKETVEEGSHDSALCEDKDFKGVRVLSGLNYQLGTST